MIRRVFLWLTFLSLFHTASVSACVCMVGAESGIKESNVVFRGYVESVYGSTARVRVIKVYKGVIKQPEIQLGFVHGNGMNCGTNFQSDQFETIATNINYSEDGTKFGYHMPECSFDGVRAAITSQPILDAYLLEIKALEAKTTQQPNNESLWLNYLAKLEQSQDYLRAIEVLEKLQALKPDNLNYQAQSAFWWMRLGKLQTSKSVFEAILAQDENNLAALRGRDQVLIFQGKGLETKGNLKDYSNMTLFKIDYSNLDMSSVNFTRTEVPYDAKFDHAKFNKSQFIDSHIEGSFKEAVFDKIVIQNTSLNGDFGGAKLSNLKFSKSYMHYSKFADAQITDVDFADTNLSSADFAGATLKNVDFTKADINNAKFSNVQCDKKTKWPAKFDLGKQGIDCRL